MPPKSVKWVRSSLLCDICCYDWEAVYPMSAYDETGECRLECPSCGHMVVGPTLGLLDEENGGPEGSAVGA